jgi:hypothetical protein
MCVWLQVWHNSAPHFEFYDLDVCNGHAGRGIYHHHHWPVCLANKLGDEGTAHSPVYGWGLDGYPLYGPYQAGGKIFAQSCWLPRDYSATSPTGCPSGERCCQLVNPYDVRAGAVDVACGPSTSGITETQSGNNISAASGIFVEDYYYDPSCTAKGGAFLDAHNGHSHDDYGYHYHVTITPTGLGVFPFFMGPQYRGCRSSGACCALLTGGCTSSGSVCGLSEGATSAAACTTGSFNMTDDEDNSTVTTAGGSSHSHHGLSQADKIALIVVLVVVIGGGLIFFAVYWLHTTSTRTFREAEESLYNL